MTGLSTPFIDPAVLGRYGQVMSPIAQPSIQNAAWTANNPIPVMPTTPTAPDMSALLTNTPTGPTNWQKFLGYYDPESKMLNPGWGPMALQGLTGLGNLYLGMQQYGLARDSLRENKRQFNLNFDAQRKLTNSRLEDRQNARIAGSPGHFASTPSYMAKWGI